MHPRPFRNNLVQNDRILDTISNKQGKVARTPKNDKNRMTCVQYDGQSAQRYVDVMQLRIIVDGRTPDDGPPIDGEPPALEEKTPRAAATAAAGYDPGPGVDMAGALEHEIKALDERMGELNREFKILDAQKQKFQKALDILRA